MARLAAFLMLLVIPTLSIADELSETAVPFAKRLVAYMQEFDTDGVAPLLYTEPMIRMGANPEQLKEMAAQSDSRLRSSGARYLRFDLDEPTDSFPGADGEYTLIPYICVLELGERKMEQQAFFIGVTNDGGRTWKFIDGIGTSRIPIETLVPGYAGPPLPAVSRRPIE